MKFKKKFNATWIRKWKTKHSNFKSTLNYNHKFNSIIIDSENDSFKLLISEIMFICNTPNSKFTLRY